MTLMRRVVPLLLLCLIAGVGCGDGDTSASAAEKPAIYRVPVKPYVVQSERFVQAVEATGVLRAEADITLTAEVGGTVQYVAEPIGVTLAEGDPVVVLDATDHNLALARAEAAVASAEAAYGKTKEDLTTDVNLFQQGLTSEQQASSRQFAEQISRAQIMEAEAQRDLARRAVQKTRITSPIHASLSETLVDVGEWIPPGTPVARVVGVDTVEAVVYLAELAVAHVEPGQEALVVADTYPDTEFHGVVYSVSPTATQSTRTFETIVRIQNDAARPLRPGMAVRVKVVTLAVPDVLVIPADAIGTADTAPHVYVINRNANGAFVTKTPVTLGLRSGRRVQITSGLSEDATIVSESVELLSDGRFVQLPGEGAGT